MEKFDQSILEEQLKRQRATVFRVYNYYRVLISFLFLFLFLDPNLNEFVGNVNPDLFTSGLLRDIGQYWNDLGNIPQATLDSWKSFAQGWRNDIRNLMDFENTASPVSDKGGSIWATIGPDRTNTNVGVVSDPVLNPKLSK